MQAACYPERMTRIINLQGPHSGDDARILARGRELQDSAYSVLKDLRSADLNWTDSVQLTAAGNPQLNTYAYEGSIGKDQFTKAQVWYDSEGALERVTASKGQDFLVHDLIESKKGPKEKLYLEPGATYFFTNNGTLLYTGD